MHWQIKKNKSASKQRQTLTLKKELDSAKSTRTSVKSAKDLKERLYKSIKTKYNYSGVESYKNFLGKEIMLEMEEVISRLGKSKGNKIPKEKRIRAKPKIRENRMKSSNFKKQLRFSRLTKTKVSNKTVRNPTHTLMSWMKVLRKS